MIFNTPDKKYLQITKITNIGNNMRIIENRMGSITIFCSSHDIILTDNGKLYLNTYVL